MKFSIKDLFSRCDQISRKLRILSDLLKKFLMENFFFVQWQMRNLDPVLTYVMLWMYVAEAYLEPIRTPAMKHFCENNQWLKAKSR